MPLLWLSLAFLSGILLGSLTNWPRVAWAGLAAASLIPWLWRLLFRRNFPPHDAGNSLHAPLPGEHLRPAHPGPAGALLSPAQPDNPYRPHTRRLGTPGSPAQRFQPVAFADDPAIIETVQKVAAVKGDRRKEAKTHPSPACKRVTETILL